jgi:hypothetical protein
LKAEVFVVVKKIGIGKADPETGLWGVLMKSERFIMNQRRVDARSDVKALKAAYSRHAGKKPPSVRRVKENEEHHELRKNLKTQLQKLLAQVYAEILEESFTTPVPLRKDRDYDHKSDWRYCLYQGIIYQFDRPDYRDDEMIQQISTLF